jgi:CRISPR-associated exonuclease Cas4
MGSIVVAIYSLGFVFPENSAMGMVMQVSALIWLMAAATILWRALAIEQQVRKEKKSIDMPEGHIVYVDLDDGSSELLVSEKYGLRGRPDHIIEKEGHYIPVELKTGRTPRGPLFSHIVQLGAYGLIIEDITGKRPPYGILKYPEKSFEIEFTDELRDIVLKKRDELLRDLEWGEAHRNHGRPGKCRACSRRKICPERLDRQKPHTRQYDNRPE